MSTRKKIVLAIFAVLLLAIAAFVLYIWFSDSKTRDPFTVVPDDAVYIIETSNLTKAWSTISDSKMWEHMITNKHFAEISKSAASLDSLIKGNETMDMLFSNRQLLLSAHMLSASDYDFLFVVNMKQASKIVFVKDYIKGIIGSFGFSWTERDFEGAKIIELTSEKSREVLYFSFIDNLFVGSYSTLLVENAIKQKDKNFWQSNVGFKAVSSEISSSGLFNFYFNYGMILRFMGVYMQQESDLVKALQESMQFTGFNVDFEDEKLSFTGYTSLADSVSSYLKALCNVNPGKADGFKIASDKTALYLALCFDDFDEFYGERLVRLV